MVHRNIRRPLLELANRISARLHDIGVQTVRQGHRPFGIVHKPALNFIPAIKETRAVSRRERPNFQLLSSLLAKFQHTFAFTNVALAPDDAFVLRPKALTEMPAAPLAHGSVRNDRDRNERAHDNDDQELTGIHDASCSENVLLWDSPE